MVTEFDEIVTFRVQLRKFGSELLISVEAGKGDAGEENALEAIKLIDKFVKKKKEHWALYNRETEEGKCVGRIQLCL